MSLDVRINRFTNRRDETVFAKVRGYAANNELLFANRRRDWSWFSDRQ